MKKNDFKEEIPWIYVFIYYKLKERATLGPYLRPKIILEVVRRICRIPKTLEYPILKQMEKYFLIKRINHQKYEINLETKNKKIKEINEKLKNLLEVSKRNRLLKTMEECGLVEKIKGTKYYILESDCDKKLDLMGNYTFW